MLRSAAFLAGMLLAAVPSHSQPSTRRHEPAGAEGSLLAYLPAASWQMERLNRLFDAGRQAAELAPFLGEGDGGTRPCSGERAARGRKSHSGSLGAFPPPSRAGTLRRFLARPEHVDRYDALIAEASRENGLDARLVKAIIAAESGFSSSARSPRGAMGLMQILPSTAESVGVAGSRLEVARHNIRAGAAYLRRLFEIAYKRFKLAGSEYARAPIWLVRKVLAAYNAGPRFLSARPWYRETRRYVGKVLLFYRSDITELRAGAGAWGVPRIDMSDPSGLWAS